MAKFFIERPIFAWVIAIVIMLAGVVAVGNPCKVLRPITEKDSIRYQK